MFIMLKVKIIYSYRYLAISCMNIVFTVGMLICNHVKYILTKNFSPKSNNTTRGVGSPTDLVSIDKMQKSMQRSDPIIRYIVLWWKVMFLGLFFMCWIRGVSYKLQIEHLIIYLVDKKCFIGRIWKKEIDLTTGSGHWIIFSNRSVKTMENDATSCLWWVSENQ